MDLHFKTKTLKKQLTDDQKFVKIYGPIAEKLKQRLNVLYSAENLKTLGLIPHLRLHQPVGTQKGEWSIGIKANWRLAFTVETPIVKREDGSLDLTSVMALKILSIDHPNLKSKKLATLEAKKELLVPPGATLLDMIDDLKMTRAEFAERLGKSKNELSDLIHGETTITRETAHKLEMVLGVPEKFWRNLGKHYQKELSELQRLAFQEDCKKWVTRFPLTYLKKHGILPHTKNKVVLSEALLKFFRVSSPKEWNAIYHERSLSLDIELKHTLEVEAISVWLRLGALKAEKSKAHAFDRAKTSKKIDVFHEICRNPSENWLQDLIDLCTEQGFVLAVIPQISKAPIFGAVRWTKRNTLPILQLTSRNKNYNTFWFSFYHELAHILLHDKHDIFLEGLKTVTQDEKKEEEADDFAQNILDLPQKLVDDFPKDFKFLIRSDKRQYINELTRKYDIFPGIIVSQLQRLQLIDYSDNVMNSLKIEVEL